MEYLEMGTFPLRNLPTLSWRHGTKYFGARRGRRVHAACDLLAPAGTEVLAVEDGHILRGPYGFPPLPTYAIDVQHGGFIARYSEIDRVLPKDLDGEILGPGSTVLEGQVIAFVGVQRTPMLHFELYRDVLRDRENLTDRSPRTSWKYTNVRQANYERRDDLMDPTPYLDVWGALLALQQANLIPKIITHAEAHAEAAAEAKQAIRDMLKPF